MKNMLVIICCLSIFMFSSYKQNDMTSRILGVVEGLTGRVVANEDRIKNIEAVIEKLIIPENSIDTTLIATKSELESSIAELKRNQEEIKKEIQSLKKQ